MGNLEADPETKFTPSGTQVTSLTLATNDTWIDDTGKRRQRTEWHRVIAWRRLAEIASRYLKKGNKIRIEGRLRTRHWKDRVGQRHYVTEIMASDLDLMEAGGPGELDMKYAREHDSQLELDVITRSASSACQPSISTFASGELPL